MTCSPLTDNGPGSLQFLDPETFEVVYKIEYPEGVVSFFNDFLKTVIQSAIRCIWHPRLNQILVSLSGLSTCFFNRKLF